METDYLMRSLNMIMPLSGNLQAAIKAYLKEEHFPKRHLLLEEGQVSKRLYFIKEGFARSFYFTKEMKECTAWFMGKGDFMISVYSFITQEPAVENIELLQPSVLQSISWAQLQSLYADFKEFNFIGRTLTEKYYIESERRAILLRTLSAQERYERLILEKKDIFRFAPVGQIASYLGLSLETLSRLRGKRIDLNQ